MVDVLVLVLAQLTERDSVCLHAQFDLNTLVPENVIDELLDSSELNRLVVL